MSFPPWNPYGNFVTSDPNGIPVDRRPLRLGLYLQNQTISPVHSNNGSRLLQTFKYFRNMGWAGNAMFVAAGVLAVTPELIDMSVNSCQVGLLFGGTTALGGAGVKFWSKIQTDEVTAEMETEFNSLKEKIILHNKTPANAEKQMVVPYLADPSLSERLAEAQIAQTNSNTTNTLSNVPNNVATAGIMLEALKTFKGMRKN
jgi:hypothetical protein